MENKNIKKFILDILLELDDSYEIDDGTQLFEEGILDSVVILYLITELESEYGIQIPMEDVIEQNFKDIASMESYLRGRIMAD